MAVPLQARAMPSSLVFLVVLAGLDRHGSCHCFWSLGSNIFSFSSSLLDNYLQTTASSH